MSTRVRAALVLLAYLLLAGCSRGEEERATLRVFAASSLTDAFEELAQAFEKANPDTTVSLVFAGSQVLRLQIEQGAPASVFASANTEHVRALARTGRAQGAQVFAHNELVVIVPRDNPAGIHRFEELPRARRLVIGTETVPVGRYTRRLFERAAAHFGAEFESAVWSSVVSHENNVRLIRTKVALGQADAAVVYRSDALGLETVKMIEIPENLALRSAYVQAIVGADATNKRAAAWLDFVNSSAGQVVLVQHGFYPVGAP